MPARTLSILAVEPWLGGSHQQFLEQWRRHSRHEIDVLGLPARHWRWRMRSAAWELARELPQRKRPDLIFASDFLDLPSFLGQLPPHWGHPPAAIYFHENQLTYPLSDASDVERTRERDQHLAFTNVLSCVRADLAVFNSDFHRRDFLQAAIDMCGALPRPNPRRELEDAIDAAAVVGPGIDLTEIPLGAGGPEGTPLRVLFNQRWEFDKDPVGFLRAVLAAREHRAEIELMLLGESFELLPPGAKEPLAALETHIVRRGFAKSREEYARLVGSCDVVVSTSRHEFFGIAVAEALAAGCRPLLPNRLAYPELVANDERVLYEREEDLVREMVQLAESPAIWRDPGVRADWRTRVERHDARRVASDLDELCARFSPVPGTS